MATALDQPTFDIFFLVVISQMRLASSTPLMRSTALARDGTLVAARRLVRTSHVRGPRARTARKVFGYQDESSSVPQTRSPHFGMSRAERKAAMRPYEPTQAERKLAAALQRELTSETCTSWANDSVVTENDVAFVVVDVPNELGEPHQIVWFASAPKDDQYSSKPWNTPIVRLVLGVREAAISADQSAHRWMRHRILSTTACLTEFDKAIVKVCASKASVVVPSDGDEKEKENVKDEDDDADSFSADADSLLALPRYDANHWARFAVKRGIRESRQLLPPEIRQVEENETKEDDAALFEWARAFVDARLDDNYSFDDKKKEITSIPLHERNRAVVAMLVTRDGTLLDVAVNTNSRNQVLHAEVNLLAKWLPGFGGVFSEDDDDDDVTNSKPKPKRLSNDSEKKMNLLPPGSRLLVTLQCCRMCASLVCLASDDAAEHGNKIRFEKNPTQVPLLDVVYLDEDVGTYSSSTQLQRRNRERKFEG